VAAPEPEPKPAAPEPVVEEAVVEADEGDNAEEVDGRYCVTLVHTYSLVNQRTKRKRSLPQRRRSLLQQLPSEKVRIYRLFNNVLQLKKPQKKPDGKQKKRKRGELRKKNAVLKRKKLEKRRRNV